MQFTGNMVALVTPFRNGSLDLGAFRQLIERVIDGGAAAVIPCGTTGESPTLSHEEHDQVIRVTAETVAGRVDVIAGTGSNSTAEAVRLTRAAAESGAHAVLSVSPYYNKPTQGGLIAHFQAVAEASALPVVLYDIPGRCGVRMARSTIRTLSEHENVQAIKIATGDVEDVSFVTQETSLKALSGDDALTLPMLALGAQGVISVISNLLPRPMTELVEAALEGDFARARSQHNRLWKLMNLMFIESNPAPVKAALARIGVLANELRLPLCPISAESSSVLEEALAPFLPELTGSH